MITFVLNWLIAPIILKAFKADESTNTRESKSGRDQSPQFTKRIIRTQLRLSTVAQMELHRMLLSL